MARADASEFLHCGGRVSLTEVGGGGGQGGGRGEPARLVPRGPPLAARPAARDRASRRPASAAILARGGRAVRRAHERPPAPRGGHDLRRRAGRPGPAHPGCERHAPCPRPRLRVDPAVGGDNALEATLGSARADWRGAWASTAPSGCRASTRTREFTRDPGGRAGPRWSCARSRAQAATTSRRTSARHLPPAVPRAGPAPRRSAASTRTRTALLVRYDDQYRTDLVGTLGPTSARTAT